MALIEELLNTLEDLTSESIQFRVFALQYAEADEMADAIGDLFEDDQTRSSNARRSLRRVRAEADERTNSIMVCAPEDVMKTIERLVKEVDTVSEDVTEIRVFPLLHADAEETATMVNDVFEEQSQSRQSNSPQRFGGRMFGRGGRGGRNNQPQQSERQVQQETVVAVADTRTNSVVVRAAGGIMVEITLMIEAIDENPAKKKKVFVYDIKNASPEEIGAILESLYGAEGARTNIQNRNTQNNRTTNRAGGGTTRNNSTRGGGASGGGGFGSTR